jgi:hypothetical protein
MKKKKKVVKKRKKNGKKLVEKAGLAIKNEFYLEASWILSAIIEKKMKGLLVKLENHKPGNGFSLEQCIKRVKYLHITSKSPILTTNFTIKFIDDLRNWKNQRNNIMKDILEVHVSKARMERLAMDGIRLLKELNSAYKKFKAEYLESDLEDSKSEPALKSI